MDFEWDEEKRQKVIRERRVDILYAARIFEGRTLTRIDDRRDYGEERWISLAWLGTSVSSWFIRNATPSSG